MWLEYAPELLRSRIKPMLGPIKLPVSGSTGSHYLQFGGHKRTFSPFKLATILLIVVGLFWALHGSGKHEFRNVWHKGLPGFEGPVLTSDIVPCKDPAGATLQAPIVDVLKSEHLNQSAPKPFAGSYHDLGLDQIWISANERYGRYGRPSDDGQDSTPAVDWNRVNWAEVQNTCAVQNQGRFGGNVPVLTPTRRLRPPSWRDSFRLHSWFDKKSSRSKTSRGRTAIVLRAWSTFDWQDEDLWSFRALITETALASGGDYAIFILMDVKKEHTKVHPNLWEDPKFYDHLLDSLVPAEFRDITVLFNRDLLMDWYPEVNEYRPEFQMFQPLQLFAQQYPEFDFYWTVEMDVRFLGHTGALMNAFEDFSRQEPRKQARQRMSHHYLPSVYGDYANFTRSIDHVLDGGDAYYEGVRIPDIQNPIGTPSPFDDPNQDDFKWGVGEEADFMTFSPCNNVTVHHTWLYYKKMTGFKLGPETPGRIICPVTISRTSWNLLNEIHNRQIEEGKWTASESTMGNFALWNGMKVSVPPMPQYSRQDHLFKPEDLNKYINGGPPSREHDGMSVGEWVYAVDGKEYLQHTPIKEEIEPTYRYKSHYPQDLWEAWMKGQVPEGEKVNQAHLPTLMVKDGTVYLPNTMFHPVKTWATNPKNNEPPAFLKIFGLDEW